MKVASQVAVAFTIVLHWLEEKEARKARSRAPGFTTPLSVVRCSASARENTWRVPNFRSLKIVFLQNNVMENNDAFLLGDHMLFQCPMKESLLLICVITARSITDGDSNKRV